MKKNYIFSKKVLQNDKRIGESESLGVPSQAPQSRSRGRKSEINQEIDRYSTESKKNAN